MVGLTDNLILRVPALLLAVTFHELAHGMVAYRLGDPTAKQRGRLTLNPLAHLDPMGTLMLVLVGFGWAKPVPVNPYYFRVEKEYGMFLVGLAGPVANFLLAFITAFIIYTVPMHPLMAEIMLTAFLYNVFLGVFNLMPVPPLDGSRVLAYLMPSQLLPAYNRLEQYGFLVLILILLLGGVQHILIPAAGAVIKIIVTTVELITSV